MFCPDARTAPGRLVEMDCGSDNTRYGGTAARRHYVLVSRPSPGYEVNAHLEVGIKLSWPGAPKERMFVA